MDFWTNLAFSVLLQLVANRKDVVKYFPVLAKLYVKIEFLATLDQRLRDEIAHQREKELPK